MSLNLFSHLSRLLRRPPAIGFNSKRALSPRTMSTNIDAARAQVADQIKVDIFTLTQDEVRCVPRDLWHT